MGWNVVGGVRMDADESHFKPILEKLDIVEERFPRVRALFAEGPAVDLRCSGIGVMSKKEAILGRAVGPIGRASGITKDYRQDHYTYRDYFDFNTVVRHEGDNYARTLTRFDEIPESISLIRQAIENIPKGEIRTPVELKSGYRILSTCFLFVWRLSSGCHLVQASLASLQVSRALIIPSTKQDIWMV